MSSACYILTHYLRELCINEQQLMKRITVFWIQSEIKIVITPQTSHKKINLFQQLLISVYFSLTKTLPDLLYFAVFQFSGIIFRRKLAYLQTFCYEERHNQCHLKRTRIILRVNVSKFKCVANFIFSFEIDMSQQASCDVTRAPRVAVEINNSRKYTNIACIVRCAYIFQQRNKKNCV